MNKRPQSIDGFTLQRRTDSDAAVRPKTSAKKIAVQRPTLAQDDLESDIKSSLSRLGTGDNHKLAAVSADTEDTKKPKRSSRKERRAEKKANKSKKKKIIKWILIGVPIIALLIAGFLFFKAWMAGSSIFKGNTIDIFTSKTKLKEDENGWTNVLIASTSGYSMDAGAWDGATLTDSIMVLSVNQTTNEAFTMSLPRDLWVSHPDCPSLGTKSGKLNEVYACGSDLGDNEEAGMKMLMETVGDIVGLDMHYYAHPNWQALVQVVDAIGGIDVTIDSSDSRGIYDVATKIKYPNGTAHLNGERALALARSRGDFGGYGLSGGNFDREKYQREIMSAVQKKAVSANTLLNISAVSSLMDAIGGNLITSFESSEVQTLIDLTKNVASVTSLPFNNRPDDQYDLFTTGTIGTASVVLPMAGKDDYSDIQAYIAKNLSSDPAVREGAIIDVLNGSGVTGAAKVVANDLEKSNFAIGEIDNAPNEITGNVEIYDLSNGKMSNTSAALAKKYNVTVKKGELAGYDADENVSFIIIVGPELANKN